MRSTLRNLKSKSDNVPAIEDRSVWIMQTSLIRGPKKSFWSADFYLQKLSGWSAYIVSEIYMPKKHELLFRLSGKISRPSGNFLNCPETFQTVWHIFRLSRNFQDLYFVLTWFWANFVGTRKRFQNMQKISGQQCWRATRLFCRCAIFPYFSSFLALSPQVPL